MAKRMNLAAKRAKAAADAIDAYLEGFGEKENKEDLVILRQAHEHFVTVVSNPDNGGPAWNAEDGTWEY